MERRTKDIVLFGKELILSERTAMDVLELDAEIKKRNETPTSDPTFMAYMMVTTIQDALKINIEKLNWYNFRRKSVFKNILTSKYLLQKLSLKEISIIFSYVYELEGVDIKQQTDDNAEKKSQ